MIAKPIRIFIGGSQHHGSSTPNASDLIEQIRDFIHVLQAAEVACCGKTELRWRVSDASARPSFGIDLTPDSLVDGVDIDHSLHSVIAMVSSTVNHAIATGNFPDSISSTTSSKIDCMIERVASGLDCFDVDFSKYGKVKKICICKRKAREYIEMKRNTQCPLTGPRWRRGSMEGCTLKIAADMYGQPVLRLRSKLKGYVVKCIDSKGSLDEIGDMKVNDIIEGLRVRVFGQMHYKNLSDIDQIMVDSIYLYPPNSQLPDLLNLKRTNITNGLGAVAFVRRLRDAE